MNLFQMVKEHVNTRDFVEHIGLSVNRSSMICCPFHDDRHPSMKVDDRFFCFGCGAKGDVIDFVSKYYSVGLKQAAEYIVSEFGLQDYLRDQGSKDVKSIRKAEVKRKLPFYKRRTACITHLNHYITYLQNIVRDESPGNPEEISEAYFFAVNRLNYVNYIADVLNGFEDGTLEDQEEIVKMYGEGGFDFGEKGINSRRSKDLSR